MIDRIYRLLESCLITVCVLWSWFLLPLSSAFACARVCVYVRPALNSFNRSRFHCWVAVRLTETSCPEARYFTRTPAGSVKQCRGVDEITTLKGIRQVFDILQNPMPSWGCHKYDPVLRPRWWLTHEYSPEARNIIWLPAQTTTKN